MQKIFVFKEMKTKSQKKARKTPTKKSSCTGLTTEELYVCMLMVCDPKRCRFNNPRQAQENGRVFGGKAANMSKSKIIQGIKENLREWSQTKAFV